MPDALDTITKLIQSPPGQLAAGGVLAGIVWKFFERVEAVLTENTKLEIAVWLLGVKVGQTVEPWPETFAEVFDRVFGRKHFSFGCFVRCSLSSYAAYVLCALYAFRADHTAYYDKRAFLFPFFVMPFFGYLSLLETRILLYVMERISSTVIHVALLAVDSILTIVSGLLCLAVTMGLIPTGYGFLRSLASGFNYVLAGTHLWWRPPFVHLYAGNPGTGASLEGLFVYPAMFTTIWLWLYAGSGFLLKAARRFDIGFDWFNRKFDIEKKPLQSIGLVSGALVAAVYWSAVIVTRVVK